MPNNKSFVWSYFERGNAKSKCLFCEVNIYSAGGCTSALQRHLRRIHGVTGAATVDLVSTRNSNRTEQRKLQISQSRIDEINMAVAKTIANDLLPISFCCSKAFKYIYDLLPGYTPIQEDAMEKYIQLLNSNVRNIVSAHLQNAMSSTLTTHMWTSIENNTYMTVITHVITKDWQLVEFTLETFEIPQKHDADIIANNIRDAKIKWNLAKVSAVVTDNILHITNAISQLDICQYKSEVTCTAHTIRQIIEKSLNDEEIQEVILCANRIASHFKNSTKAAVELKRRQKQLKVTNIKLIQSSKTIWYSVYQMLERLLENRVAITSVLEWSTRVEPNLDVTEEIWSRIQYLLNVLKAPYLFCDIICNEKTSISTVRPLLNHWVQHYLRYSDDDIAMIKRFKTVTLREIEIQFAVEYSNTITTRMVASLLDPRYKNLEYETATLHLRIKDYVRGMLEEITDAEGATDSDVTSTSYQCKLEVFFKKPKIEKLSLDNQWAQYLLDSKISHDMDPCSWWKEKSEIYPSIAKLAKHFLCLPAISAGAERHFLVEGNASPFKHSTFKPENVNMLVFLYKNRKFLSEVK